MANKPFDREIINQRERPFSSDINLAGSYSDLALREVLRSFISPRVSALNSSQSNLSTAVFFGDGFKIVPTSPPSLSVQVTKGIGFIGDSEQSFNVDNVLGLNDVSTLKPIPLSENIQIPIDTPASGKRTDIIEVKSEYVLTDSQSRDIFNPTTGTLDFAFIPKTFSWALDSRFATVSSTEDSTQPLSIKQGVSRAIGQSEVVPSTTPGYTKIAEVLVRSFDEELTLVNIRDTRQIIGQYGQTVISGKCNLKNLTLPVLSSTVYAEILELNAPPGIDVRVTTRNADNRFYTITVIGKFNAAHADVQLVGSYFQDQELEPIITEWLPPLTEPTLLVIKVRNEWKPRVFLVETGKINATLSDPSVGGDLVDLLEDSAKTQPPISISEQQDVVAVHFLVERKTVQLDFAGVSTSPDDAIVDFMIVLS